MIAYIMRGLSGSGKSTIVESLIKGYKSSVIHSTDNYSIENGKYVFNSNSIGTYHKKNLEAFEQSCKEGTEVVVCDNTNILKSYYRPYVKVAEEYGYKVIIVIAGEFDPNVCFERSKHNLPLEKIQEWKEKFEL